MSSHREAPEISKDPVADNADVYAFVSPDAPSTVTLISNFVPLQDPPGGPNFFEFGDDVLYSIFIDNDADAEPEIEYQFRFSTELRDPNTFLYNTGPITSLDSQNWNKRQVYSVTRVDSAMGSGARSKVLGTKLASPPCNIGPRSTPKYEALAAAAVHSLPSGETVFCGQRNDGFFVDLGGVFDLGDLRPFQNLHLIPTPAAHGVDDTRTLNIHAIAIQIPIRELTRDRSVPKDAMSAEAVLGIWGAASRRKLRVANAANDERAETGPWVQVSRQGNPLFNEVMIPLGLKDKWNARQPVHDRDFRSHVQHPELSKLLPVLYPNVFPHLAALSAPRADIEAIFLTGIPKGIIPGFQNYTGKVLAEMLRLNVAIPPAQNPNMLGLVGGDLAGWPNGRRLTEDVTTVAIRALAGLTYPLVNKSYTPDAAASEVTQGLTPLPNRSQETFPYVSTPHDGYDAPSPTM
ncbi:MAG: DUF4331 domain-containing protein [Solirubrobacterales bacterium]|nr:DUF4331 domain-containing protein [Solirubrobacterales bacterium]